MPLKIHGQYIIDEKGRCVHLRGVNLGGSTKIPRGTHPLDLPYEKKIFSFVGRPFPLSEADEHFRRLKHWGFNTLRLLTTWEAIEPSVPGQFDEAYLDFLFELVKRANEYELYLFIDPHQDAWSRFSGGDGAPRWTLELAGFNVEKLDASEAAITMAHRYPDYPTMIWPNNWGRLASATMFTLFFGGERLAPQLKVGNESIQSFLQHHFISSIKQVAERLCGFPNVLGYGTLNEPNGGYIGIKKLSDPLPVYHTAPRLTGFESLYIPAGIPTRVPYVRRRLLKQDKDGDILLNPQRESAWKTHAHDIWRGHEVWALHDGQPILLQDDYFSDSSFVAQGLIPFVKNFAKAIREAHPEAWLFLEGEPGGEEPLSGLLDSALINASHWYDLLTLTTKHYDPCAALSWGSWEGVTGRTQVEDSFARQIGVHGEHSRRFLGNCPTLIGEFGLPMDLDGGEAFKSGDFSKHEAALSSYYKALDRNLVHSTIWNYTSDNNNDWGDQWNQEDLSIFSRSQQQDPTDWDSGARGLKGFCRPTYLRCPGIPLCQEFELETGEFFFEFDANPELSDEALLFLPEIHYPTGYHFECSAGFIQDGKETRRLTWSQIPPGRQWVRVRRRQP